MNESQLVIVRRIILRQLREADHYGLSPESMAEGIRPQGFRSMTVAEFEAQLVFLSSHGWIIQKPNPLGGPSLWSITDSGRDFLAQIGA
jgi:hypothetical protein